MLLELSHVQAGYGEHTVIPDASLAIKEGELVILMGPNGAGKSTLLKSIFNLTDIAKGSITFSGEDITNIPTHALLSRGVSFVTQGRVNFTGLTVEENLRLGAHLERDKGKVEKQLAKVYEQFPDLYQYRQTKAFALSGGQQQMLAIGRSLMMDPKLLLMDEPTLGLSPKLVKEVFSTIKQIRDQFGVSIIVVEHNIKSLLDIADRGYVLVEGKIVAEDTCSKLKVNPLMQKVFVGAFD